MYRGGFHRACAALALGGAVALGAGGCATARRQPAGQAVTPPPAALGTLQTDATTIIDSATARDWGQVSAQLSAIHTAWGSLRPDLAGRGARTGLLDSATQAISELDHESNLLSARGTAQAANRLTAFVPDMLSLYTSPVPPQLAEMTYLARAAQFDADAGQSAAVWEDARALGTQWAYIRTAAQGVDPGDASRLDLQLADLDAAVADQAGMTGGTAVPAMTMAPVTSPGGSSPGSASASSASSGSGSSASAGVGVPPSASSSVAPSATASRRSAGTSSTARASASNAATPSVPTSQRRTGTMAGSGPASPPHVAGPVQTAAQAILTTLTALQQAFQGSGRA